MRPTAKAPINKKTGKAAWGRYNIWSWQVLYHFLQEREVDVSEFSGHNAGVVIKAVTCMRVANVIEKHFDDYMKTFGMDSTDPEEIEHGRQQILLWRNCGGYRQY